MIIDLHVHTTLGSADSIIDPGELVEIAQKVGLDGVCITEHGNRRPEGVDRQQRSWGISLSSEWRATPEAFTAPPSSDALWKRQAG